MTDTERDELLRWAAEEVLGCSPCTVTPHPSSHTPGLCWGNLEEDDLLGWPGFGLAVEACSRYNLEPWFRSRHEYWIEFVTFNERPTGKWHGSHDPALAAWAALREALVAAPVEPPRLKQGDVGWDDGPVAAAVMEQNRRIGLRTLADVILSNRGQAGLSAR